MDNEASPPHKGNIIFKGILFSNIFAFVFFGLAFTVMSLQYTVGKILIFSEFVLVPIGMGIIAMKYWILLKKRLLGLLPYATLNTIIAILLSAIFMGEGVVCLIIVSPLVLAFMWSGIVIGKYIYIDKDTTLKTSTFLIFIVLFVYDTFSEHNYSNVVSDEITINAPRDVVWKYIAAHPVNKKESDYWLFNVGLPCPIQSTVTGDTIGSTRKCIFSNGATFDEVIIESNKDSLFTFNITKQPEDPEIIGHIEIKRGQFILKKNVDGTTQLIGNSWYKLNVYPVWYYDLWAIDITRNVHLRVMKHIKDLAEHDI